MPRYFFHVRNAGELIPDPEGVDMPNLDSAADELPRIVREAFRGELFADRQIEITDELGRLVLLIPLLTGPLV
jgi:hypothetical protein